MSLLEITKMALVQNYLFSHRGFLVNYKGLRALRSFFGPHLRSKYESGNKIISLHDFIRPIFLVFQFGFSLDLAVH